VMYHNDYYANFGDMSVEEYVDFFSLYWSVRAN